MAAENIDSIDALLARYVAGALPLPARLLVATHLELKPASRRFVEGLEDIAGVSLEHEPAKPVADRTARLDAIFAAPNPLSPALARPAHADGIFPRALRDFAGFGPANVPWRTKMPGFKEYDFGEIDGCTLSLFWIKPGRRIPQHTHEGSELSLVLDGAFSDINGHYGRGDISIADETVDHRPVADKERPCIGMAVTDGPLRLTGPLGQRLSDILFS